MGTDVNQAISSIKSHIQMCCQRRDDFYDKIVALSRAGKLFTDPLLWENWLKECGVISGLRKALAILEAQ